ncbi:MAG: hypothetical protein FVQ80_15260 [Planctomycetes bacterium]|nr:hypothetical protein [Planctomycetota bacterium]
MFAMIGDVVAGGFNAVDNIINGIGQGVSRIGSTFFPAPQRTQVISEITKSAPNQGDIFRKTAVENQSMIETAAMLANDWINTPFENQFAIPVKVRESRQLAEKVSTGPIEAIGGMFSDVLDWAKQAGTASREIRTAVDEIAGVWGVRSPIPEGPVEIGNSRGRVGNTNPPQTAGADIISTVIGTGRALMDQVKGLYNLAFPQQGGQPAVGIRHEIAPSKGLSAGLVLGGAALIVVLLMRKK